VTTRRDEAGTVSLLDDPLAQAARWQADGVGVAVATVVETWGSSPCPPGSGLAVSENGEMVGSVSGGCVEGSVVEAALEVIRGGHVRLLGFGVTNEQAWEVGLACGGRVQIFVGPMEERLLGELLSERAARRPGVLETHLGTGNRTLLHPDEVLDDPELEVAVRESLAGDVCLYRPGGSDPGTFLQPFPPPLRLLVVGAVHIAQPLSRMASEAGFEVSVIDPRRAFASEARFPDVEICTDWPDAALQARRLDARCAVVTLTHDPKLDDPALAAALRSDAFYLGSLGSRRTHAGRLSRLRKLGFGDADLARIHGPVGLDIGARSPAEIAVSILAEVTCRLRRPDA
jgi:xanthine dehydrogenase accessory factor